MHADMGTSAYSTPRRPLPPRPQAAYLPQQMPGYAVIGFPEVHPDCRQPLPPLRCCSCKLRMQVAQHKCCLPCAALPPETNCCCSFCSCRVDCG